MKDQTASLSSCLSSFSVAEKLKHLFLLFAGHIVKNVAQLLESNSEEGKG